MQEDAKTLTQFLRDCNLLEDSFDFYNYDGILNFFKNK